MTLLSVGMINRYLNLFDAINALENVWVNEEEQQEEREHARAGPLGGSPS